jgi:hypothetical protein
VVSILAATSFNGCLRASIGPGIAPQWMIASICSSTISSYSRGRSSRDISLSSGSVRPKAVMSQAATLWPRFASIGRKSVPMRPAATREQ